MSNKYFVVPGIFDKQKSTDLTIAIPVRVFAIETTERDVQDNFISSSIKKLRDLGLNTSEISNALLIDRVLVKQFLDSLNEEKNLTNADSKNIKSVVYMFYDKHSNALASGFVTSEQYQNGIQKISVVEDNDKIIRIKQRISSSSIHDVYILPKNKEESSYELTKKDIENNVLFGRTYNQKILDCCVTGFEDNVYVITKIYFCERNVNRFFVFDYYGEYHDNYNLYNRINSSLNDNQGLRTKIENNKRAFLKNYREKITKATNDNLRRELDVQALKNYSDLYGSVYIAYNKYEELIRAKNTGSRNIEEFIFSLGSAVYGCFEDTFASFIANQYDDSLVNRFNELLRPDDDRITANRKIYSFLKNHYSFVVDGPSEKAIKMIDGYETLERTIDQIVSEDNIYINVFNLLFIALIIADENPAFNEQFLRFSAKNPLFLSQLLQLRTIRNEKKHDDDKTQINNSFIFVGKMFNLLISMIHFMFNIKKSDEHIIENNEEDRTPIRVRADIDDTLKLKVSNINYYGDFADEVLIIKNCFETKAVGSEVLEAPYNAMSKICLMLLRLVINKYGQVDSELFTTPEAIDSINKKLSSLGSYGEFDKDDIKKKTIKINENNVQEHAFRKYAFVSVIGFLANADPNFLAAVFKEMPDLISLYNTFIKERGHNNIVDAQRCDSFYAEKFNDYQELIEYLEIAKNLASIEL